MSTYLLGAQGGVADDFARLYEVTNPVLLRYLQVTADGDHAELARTTWTTVLPELQVCPPDDDAWLELVIGAARTAVSARGAARVPSTLRRPRPSPDDVAQAVAALRACPPAEAEVLAMGAVANLGRAAVARLTGLQPSAILALVLQAQQRLDVSLDKLISVLRVPGTPGRSPTCRSRPACSPLPCPSRSSEHRRPPRPPSTPRTPRTLGALAAPAAVPVADALPQPTVVDIRSLQSSAPANAATACCARSPRDAEPVGPRRCRGSRLAGRRSAGWAPPPR